MFTLYLNNFRNFYNTLVPIKDVNFLVGENSSGKSSILSLLNILSSPSFWLNTSFYNNSVNLRLFSDLVNSGSRNQKTFEIGLFIDDVNEKTIKENNYIFLLMEFSNQKGIPVISKFNFISDKYDVKINIDKDSIKYSIKDILLKDINKHENLSKYFVKWSKESLKENSDIRTINLNKIPFGNTQIGAFRNIVFINYFKGSKTRLKYKDFIIPFFDSPMIWIGPIRTQPLDTYDKFFEDYSSKGEHTPYLLKELFENGKGLKYKMNKFGRKSGLFETLKINLLNKADKFSPFQINIILNSVSHKITNVGYGVSQILPIITEIFSRVPDSFFLIQQPEIHLHPRAQAEIGESLFNESITKNKRFLVETHSDFIIDRYRIQCRNSQKNAQQKQSKSQILYFQKMKNRNKLQIIEIDNNGDYSANQPKSFREFFLKEQLNLLGLS